MEFPESLDELLRRLADLIAAITADLEIAAIDLIAWRAEMERLLARYHLAAYMAGQESPDLTEAELAQVTAYVETQLQFLDNFAFVIQTGAEWQAGWNARAALYAEGIKAPYWKGRTKILPLPAMPGDGTTQCLTNCRCLWDVVVVDEEAGDYDATWTLGVADHCQTCLERSEQWAPLQIRDGRLVIPVEMMG